MTIKPSTVFVTGANGFIAQHIIKQLLEKGYNVVGTVRSTEKGEQLKKLVQGYENQFTYEIISDIVKEDAFYNALQNHPEVTVFLHTASPVNIYSKNPEEDLLIPAVSGTKNVLNTIKKYAPQVTNFVYTSTGAAMAGMVDFSNPKLTVDESTWNPVTWEQAINEPGCGYEGSKTFAERAVWDFAEAEKPNFVVNTILPTYCLGPQPFEVKDASNTAANTIGGLLKLTPDSVVADIGVWTCIDVRDVARAHIAAFEDKNIKGQRLILNNCKFTNQMIADIIRRNFPELKSRLPVADPDKSFPSLVVNNEKTRKLLGWDFIDLETSAVDAVKQILEAKALVIED